MIVSEDSHDVREVLARSRELVLALVRENSELGQLIGEVQRVLVDLEGSLEPGHEQLAGQRAEITELRARLARHEDSRQQKRRRLIESQHQALMTLYVTTHELFEAREPGEVLAIIVEVVCNLIGCEELAIYAVAELDGVSTLVPEKTLGLGPERIATRVRFGEGLIGEVAASGQCFIPGRPTSNECPAHEHGITACVPLCFAEEPVAVLVLYGLLGHKVGGLTPVDRQTLAMLSHQTGLAIRVAELRARELKQAASH